MPHPAPDRLRRFGEELDQIRARAEARLGADDVRYVKRLERFSRVMELCGRVLLHFSFEPLGFSAGVAALWLHKQLQATEIGHSALHGAWDGLEGAERYQAARYRWDTPIDEASWRRGHNIRHHQYTNVAGKDPDIHFGPVRLTKETPHAPHHAWQLPFALLVAFPTFAFSMSMHFSGLLDVYAGNGRPEEFDFIAERSRAAVADAHKRALRKWVPYYFKNFVFFPLLAGPGFLKVLLGNLCAEVLRDLYSAAIVLYEMLAGRTPIAPAGKSEIEVRQEQLALSAPPVRSFFAQLPPAIDAFFERALAKDPNARFPDAIAMGAAARAVFGVEESDAWRALAEMAGHARAPAASAPARMGTLRDLVVARYRTEPMPTRAG